MTFSIPQYSAHSPLLLPPPRIAGLLPARVGTPDKSTNTPPTTFIYTNAELSQVPDSARVVLLDAARRLLDAATRYLAGAPDEPALFMAEHVFHEAVVAVHPQPAPKIQRPHSERATARAKSPMPTKEAMDREIDVLMAEAAVRIQESQEQAKRKLAAWRQRKGQ